MGTWNFELKVSKDGVEQPMNSVIHTYTIADDCLDNALAPSTGYTNNEANSGKIRPTDSFPISKTFNAFTINTDAKYSSCGYY